MSDKIIEVKLLLYVKDDGTTPITFTNDASEGQTYGEEVDVSAIEAQATIDVATFFQNIAAPLGTITEEKIVVGTRPKP